ncbi:Copia protein [Sesamum angolense]|uniref:Copia protein n=1 Tax=Sesamum angolense TaxID=2727404 RepID=A0AAE1WA76_9LAMI|nr:Copia protein [Sesamum angolense]
MFTSLTSTDVSTDSNLDFSVPNYEEEAHAAQPPDIDNILPELRKSTRTISKPPWMNDFLCNSSINQTPPTISAIISAHAVFVASISSLQEPQTYNQAETQPVWINAMKAEFQALENNQTWDITSLPQNKRAIGCRWIYKFKLRPNDTVDRHKARLVAKGYNKKEEVDFFESFSPVAKVVTVRTLLIVATSAGWHIHQLYINNAFLRGHLEEEIYMNAPE